MQNIGLLKVYDFIEETLPGGANDEVAALVNVEFGFYTSITNDDTVNEFSVKLNDTGNDGIIIKAGETLLLNELQITAIYMSNVLLVGIPFRILIYGK